MTTEQLIIVNWLDKGTQEKIVQKFIKQELTPVEFAEALESSTVIIKELLNSNIINDLKL